MCEWVPCHGGEINCCSSTCPDVYAESLRQTFQNIRLKLAIDLLTMGYEFLVDNALYIKRNYHRGLNFAANLVW
jgi:hypothetical protein